MHVADYIQLLVGIGTILIAWVAIFGSRFTNRFFPARLQILLHNPNGQLEIDNAGPKYCFHLWIKNTKPWIPVNRVRILLRAASLKSGNEWQPILFPVPRQFVWAPSEHAPRDPTVSDSEILDFGLLSSGCNCFMPALYAQGGQIDVTVQAKQTVKYILDVQADGYFDRYQHIVELSWDGVFPESTTLVPDHLRINLSSITKRPTNNIEAFFRRLLNL